jgi:crotonobetainyl-CoA:carnitine CoA-transferase CaiB-like acyl-CoA transferase
MRLAATNRLECGRHPGEDCAVDSTVDMHASGSPGEILAGLWHDAGGDAAAMAALTIAAREATLPSVFRVDLLAGVSTAAAGLAAAEYHRMRSGQSQPVRVDTRHAEIAFLSERYLRVSGEWDDHKNPLWGYYRSRDGRYVQLHTTFPHHLAGHLELLGCADDHEQVSAAVARWDAHALEDAMAARMLPGVMMRSRDEWLDSAQGQAVAGLPLLEIMRIGDAPPLAIPAGERPLSGIRVLDLTKVIAGPVCGRTLAEHGADVLRVHARRLPFVPRLVIDTGRGKRSCHLDLAQAADRERFEQLLAGAQVMTQGYRPGAIAAHGYGPQQVAAMRPGIVYLSLCAWSHAGPWSARRGFDSLVQMASGVAHAGARAVGCEDPHPLPCQALDHGTGYLAAFGVLMALARQAREGGSWHVRVSLAQTAEWLHRMGPVAALDRETPPYEAVAGLMDSADTPFGTTQFVRPVAQLGATPGHWARGAVPLGHDSPEWV